MDIICYLVLGAWNFFQFKTQLYLHIQFDLFKIIVEHDNSLESGLSAGNRRIDMNLVAILQGISAIYNPATDQYRVTRRFESQNDSQYFIHRDRRTKFKTSRRISEPGWNTVF